MFTNRQFKNMIARNSDGLGIMWRENGRVKSVKCMGTDKEKFKLFQTHRNKASYAMHARYKTHGLVNEANCHPYKLLDIDDGDAIDLYVMHNGTLDAPEIDKDMSDTWHYMEYILKPIVKADVGLIWDSSHIQSMITKAIGASRLLFMRSDDVQYPVLIFNSASGKDEHNCWLSNSYGASDAFETKRTDYSYLRRESRFDRDDDYRTQYGWWDEVSKTYRYDDEKKARDEYAKKAVEENTDKYEKKGELFLPKPIKDDKIVQLRPNNMLVENPNENLLYVLRELRSLSDTAIKDYIRDDPDITADIIMELYAKNTMDYETIIKLIKDPIGCDNMVNLIRHMAIDEDKAQTKLRV